VGGNYTFGFGVDNNLFFFCLVMSTGSAKTKHQEQGENVCVFHNFLFFIALKRSYKKRLPSCLT
jgi:hypothetical protein